MYSLLNIQGMYVGFFRQTNVYIAKYWQPPYVIFIDFWDALFVSFLGNTNMRVHYKYIFSYQEPSWLI